MKREDSGSGLSCLDGAICLYLALPVLIFCAWFKWPFAILLAVLVVYGFSGAVAGALRSPVGVSWRFVGAVGAVASVWVALAGTGHFFYANSDWSTRDAVLRDLTVTAWPPGYPGDDAPLILRAPVAYYLLAAVIGTPFGVHVADFALYAWTVLGFALFLLASATLFETPRQRAICIAVLVGFGGMDLAGYFFEYGRLPALGQHIGGWARFAQYSSNPTLLFWVPNHALPAWLGIVLVLRLWRRPVLARIASLMAAAVPLWSPLAAIGLAPYFLAGLDWRRDWRELVRIRTSLTFVALAAVVARFITLDSQSIPGGWAIDPHRPFAFLGRYAVFCVLEFGLLAGVLLCLKVGDRLLGLSVLILLALPFYKFGLSNDLVMRSSIPALTVLAYATVRPLADRHASRWRYVLMGVLGVGALGAAQEPLRALIKPRWAPSNQSLADLYNPHGGSDFGALPPHYVASLSQPALATLLRAPSLVPSRSPDTPRAHP